MRNSVGGENLLQTTAAGICPGHGYKHDQGGNMAI
jgi:hypothetical protein